MLHKHIVIVNNTIQPIIVHNVIINGIPNPVIAKIIANTHNAGTIKSDKKNPKTENNSNISDPLTPYCWMSVLINLVIFSYECI